MDLQSITQVLRHFFILFVLEFTSDLTTHFSIPSRLDFKQSLFCSKVVEMKLMHDVGLSKMAEAASCKYCGCLPMIFATHSFSMAYIHCTIVKVQTV